MSLFPLFVGRNVTKSHNRRKEGTDGETDEGADEVAPGSRTEERADGVVKAI
jgi:hypothetical protein